MMGGAIDMMLLEWIASYLGIDDLDAVVLDLIEIRNWSSSKR